VLERASGLEERVALDVVEEVAGIGRWEEAEAALLLRRKQLVAMRARAARGELELRLVAEPLECLRNHLTDERSSRPLSERLERRDPGQVQALDLVVANPGDAREVVVLVPAPLAELEEVADSAVADRVRVGVGAVRDRLREAAAGPAEKGAELVGPVRLHVARAEDDVHPLGQPPLDPLELVRIEGQLEDVRRLRTRARELRVPGLVREGA